MKKLLLILLLASGAMATQVNTTKFTGTTWGANDTATTSGNFTIDSTVTIGAFWRFPIAQAYTLSSSAGKTVNLSNSGDAWKDSTTGAATYPAAINFLANNAFMKIAAASGTITGSGCALSFAGTGCAITDNKGFIGKSLTLLSDAEILNNGSSQSLYSACIYK
jgi:hypothetical protein